MVLGNQVFGVSLKPEGLKRQESNSAPNSMHFQSPGPSDRFNIVVDHSKLATAPVISVFPDNLVLETERLTAAIQKLLTDAQAGRQSSFRSHAEEIRSLIAAMFTLVPQRFRTGSQLEKCLEKMAEACVELTAQCGKGVAATSRDQREAWSCQIVQSAFEVAKSAKQLMILIQTD